jgi:hypothetical protein
MAPRKTRVSAYGVWMPGAIMKTIV